MNPITLRTIRASLAFHRKEIRKQMLNLNIVERERFFLLHGIMGDINAALRYVKNEEIVQKLETELKLQ